MLAGAVPCTVSVGVATSDEMAETIEELLARADVALYSAKAGGRNRVVVAGSPADETTAILEPEPETPTTTR